MNAKIETIEEVTPILFPAPKQEYWILQCGRETFFSVYLGVDSFIRVASPCCGSHLRLLQEDMLQKKPRLACLRCNEQVTRYRESAVNRVNELPGSLIRTGSATVGNLPLVTYLTYFLEYCFAPLEALALAAEAEKLVEDLLSENTGIYRIETSENNPFRNPIV